MREGESISKTYKGVQETSLLITKSVRGGGDIYTITQKHQPVPSIPNRPYRTLSTGSTIPFVIYRSDHTFRYLPIRQYNSLSTESAKPPVFYRIDQTTCNLPNQPKPRFLPNRYLWKISSGPLILRPRPTWAQSPILPPGTRTRPHRPNTAQHGPRTTKGVGTKGG